MIQVALHSEEGTCQVPLNPVAPRPLASHCPVPLLPSLPDADITTQMGISAAQTLTASTFHVLIGSYYQRGRFLSR
jgi:hypothetical protein